MRLRAAVLLLLGAGAAAAAAAPAGAQTVTPPCPRAGDFVGAPSTWISGLDDAEGGIHMVAQPSVGQTWLQGWVPSIEFLDCARVFTIRHEVCVPFKCYSPYLRTNEQSPLDPAGGIQTK